MTRFKQRDRADCGPTALAWLASLHGRNLSVTQIRLKAGTTDRGTSIHGMLVAAGDLGFEGRAYRLKMSELNKLPTPHISYVKNSSGAPHYVVVRQVDNRHVIILDPEGGIERKLPLAEYAARSLGAVILIRPRALSSADSQTASPWSFLCVAIYAERKNYIIAIGCGGVASLLTFSMTIYLRVIVDYVIPFENMPLLRLITLAMCIILAVRFSLLFAQEKLTSVIAHNIDVTFFIRFTDKIFGQAQSTLDTFLPSELIARFMDLAKVRMLVTEAILRVCTTVITAILGCLLLLSVDLALGGFAICAVAITLIVIVFFALKLAQQSEGLHSEKSKLTLQLSECFAQSSVYRALSLQYRSVSLLSQRFTALGEVSEGMSHRSWQLQAITGMLPMVISIGVLLVGTLSVMKLELSVGRLFAVYTTAAFIMQPLVSLAGSCGVWAQAFHSLTRLSEMLALPHESSGGAYTLRAHQPLSIEYESVLLNAKNPVSNQQELSFTVNPGTLTVLLGRSAGIANALVGPIRGLRPLMHGRILINGIDLKEYGSDQVGAQIAWSPSKTDLLRGTLLENLTSWDEAPDLVKIKELCELFAVWEVLVALPKGLHTEVGHGNYLFNPAMRRLLALIRAFYRSGSGLVLEDPTVDLGLQQRRLVCSYVQELVRRGLCVIVATHDRAFTELTSQVIVVGEGVEGKTTEKKQAHGSADLIASQLLPNPPVAH